MEQHQTLNSIVNQTDAILPIEMTNATGTYIHDLNEYCLLDIFSTNILTLFDLCPLAETCTRFKQIIQRVFPKEFGIVSTASTDNYTFRWKDSSKFMTSQDVERILKNFGSHLRELSIYGDEAAVDLIAKYCGDVTLKRLEIHGLESIEGLRELKSIFKRLLVLSVNYCVFDQCELPGMACDSLIELEITGSTGCFAILKTTFPNLKRFSFRHSRIFTRDYVYNTNHIAQFVARHKRLRILNLQGDLLYASKELVQAIGKSYEHLEELTLQSSKRPKVSYNYFRLLRLPKLRKLSVHINVENCDHMTALLGASTLLEAVNVFFVDEVPIEIFSVISQQQHLRELILYFYSFERIPWSAFTKLRKLCLFERLEFSKLRAADLLNIIRQLTNLEELYVHGFTLSKRDFFDIVRIVARRSNVLTLMCMCDFDILEHCDANQKVRLTRITELD